MFKEILLFCLFVFFILSRPRWTLEPLGFIAVQGVSRLAEDDANMHLLLGG